MSRAVPDQVMALQATPDAKIQSPALMAVLNRIAVGADVSELVSIVCRVRRYCLQPAVPFWLLFLDILPAVATG